MSVSISILESYLNEDPHDEFLRYALALEYKELGNFQLAYDHFLTLREQHPDYLPIYYMAGKTAEDLQLFTEALEWYSAGGIIAIRLGNGKTLNELNSAAQMLIDEMSEE